MTPDAELVVAWTPPSARRRRLVFEPRGGGGYTRREEEWMGEHWRFVGEEIVADVTSVVDAGTLD